MLRCSHVLCKVSSVAAAVRRYRALGFTVEWGSAEERAHNALVWFEEGPFIELFELPRRASFLRRPVALVYGAAAGARLARWAESDQGWCDVALEPASDAERSRDPTDLRALHAAVRAAGVPVSRVVRGRRRRPDGELVRYRFFAPEPADLPFVVSVYDPPQRPLRIAHPNGARRIEQVRMAIHAADRARFDALAGTDRWLRAEPGDRTGVLDVTLSGLTHPPDPRLTEGARFALTPVHESARADATRGRP